MKEILTKMKRVIKYQTFDFIEHNSFIDAEKHLGKLYANHLSKLSHKLIGLKLSKLSEVINDNLAELSLLIKIKDDQSVINEKDYN